MRDTVGWDMEIKKLRKYEKIGVGIIGFGTVGTGVVRILQSNAEEIRRRLGIPLELIKLADLDIERDRGVSVGREILTTRAEDVINHPDIQIVVELVGGYQPAKDLILSALSKGKSVVTANKALLADHCEQLWQTAQEKGLCGKLTISILGGGHKCL